MANTLGRNLNLCFTKIKRPPSSQSPFQEDHNRPLSSSTSTTLIKNFNSLYDFTLDCTTNTTTTTTTTSGHLYTSESDEEPATTPDFATAFASQRFFFSSPGRSNSIIDSSSTASTSSSPSPPESDKVVGDKIAIPTYSPDPFVDFRRSMQEMVEARDNLIDVSENWDYLHELLMCYLTLNPKSTHKFIVSAFADLLVSLMASSKEHDPQKSILFNDSCKISRRQYN